MSQKVKNQAVTRESSEDNRLSWARAIANPILHVFATPFLVFKRVCFVLGFALFLVVSAGGLYAAHFIASLPQVNEMTYADLQNLAKRRIEERSTIKTIKPRWVALSEISRGYLYSVVTSEDATFFEHDGFNFDAILNSLAENLRERKAAYGASTISQQVVKNLFLDSEKTVSRKVREFLLTRTVERKFTKNEILELYLNMAEFGPDLFGVEAAARHYFMKLPGEINAAEGAFISLMLPSPRRNYFAIFQNHNLTRPRKKRLERVLRDMLYEEFITETQYRQYVRFNYFGQGSRTPARAGE